MNKNNSYITGALDSSRSAKPSLKKLALSLCGAAMLCAGQAQAGVMNVDFEELQWLYGSSYGDALYEAGDLLVYKDLLFSFSSLDTGSVGSIVDGSDPYNCYGMKCPVNNGSSYYAGVNDGWLTISQRDPANLHGIRLLGMDFGFVETLAGLGSYAAGKMVLTASRFDGSFVQLMKDFPLRDAQGEHQFARWDDIDTLLGGERFSAISLNACLYDLNGDCVREAAKKGSFAIDNLSVDVPEPAGIAVFGFALAGLVLSRRRQQQVS
ncbi:NF038120 family PEP-CTERM protein [Rheinheimera sp.]|uniref:NF038120 family PEP-CTERM protein n=1 Tax=Rheinheimera sp. TaxID=1869214 RepID=UPI002FDE69CA